MRDGQNPWLYNVLARRWGFTVGKAAFTSTKRAPTNFPLDHWFLVYAVKCVSASSVERWGRPQ